MITSEITAQQASEVPIIEVGEWLAKSAVLQYAQKNAPYFFTEDWGASGQIYWHIAEQEAQGSTVPTELYETAVMTAIKGDLSLGMLQRAVEDDDEHDDTLRNVRAQKIGNQALREGYLRIGVVEKAEATSKLEASLGAVAAACFSRADIHEAVDRCMYDREPELLIAKTALLKAAGSRKLQLTLWQDQPDQRYSVYALTQVYNHKPEKLAKLLDIDPDEQTGRSLWWRELKLDFAKIDAEVERIKDEEAAS